MSLKLVSSVSIPGGQRFSCLCDLQLLFCEYDFLNSPDIYIYIHIYSHTYIYIYIYKLEEKCVKERESIHIHIFRRYLDAGNAHAHRGVPHIMYKLCLNKNIRDNVTAEINTGKYTTFCHFE